MARPEDHSCGLGPALRVLGGKWRPAIMCELHDGSLRFGALRRRIAGISEKMLFEEVRALEALGVVRRTVIGERPAHVDYALTSIGLELNRAVRTLAEWGAAHGPAATSAPPSRRDTHPAPPG
jgi:DNA-binding HxlR family transcriptional regulator